MPSSPHDNRRSSNGMGLSTNRKQTSLAVQQDHAGARPEHIGGFSLVPRPKTGSISDVQLLVKFKANYAGLVMVEAKCIDIDETQPAATEWNRSSKGVGPGSAQWDALIALHKQLLHEHYDIFLASQHPSASPAPSNMACKYATPARMWSNWIHAYLERLRRRLPGSRHHTLALIYIAYSMMALFYETVPAFEDTWIECLGELGHRPAIEFGEPIDCEIWSRVANKWYKAASRKGSSLARLSHHLAILARPSTLERLTRYTRHWTGLAPFHSSTCFLFRLLNPVLDAHKSYRPSLLEVDIVHGHTTPFYTVRLISVMSCSSKSKWLRTLDQQLTPQAGQVQTILPLKGTGLDIAPSNLASLSNSGSVPQRIFNPGSMLANDVSSGLEYTPNASCRSVSTTNWMKFIEYDCNMGGVLGDKTSQLLLPEDYTLRGQSSTGRYLPPIWFLPAVGKVDQHHSHTTSELISPRERLKCFGTSIKRWVGYDRPRSHHIPYTPILKVVRSFTLPLPSISIFVAAVSASPIDNANAQGEAMNTLSVAPSQAAWFLPFFAVVFLLLAYGMATKKGPIPVWGSLMAVLSYSWWVIRDDAAMDLWLACNVVLMWMVSAYMYGSAMLQKHAISESIVILILLEASLLDITIVGATTPTGSPLSQANLISWSLPCFALTLAITINLIAWIRQSHSHIYQSNDQGIQLPMLTPDDVESSAR